MPEIRVRPTGSESACPFCREAVALGRACPECGTRYHDECAQLLGRCAVLGCAGAFAAARAEAVPRLAAVARRLGAPLPWDPEEAAAHGPWVTFFLPAPRAVQRRGDLQAAVAEALGQTAYDARIRVMVPYPELLARVGSLDEGRRIAGRLGALGLEVRTIALGDLVAPLARLEAASFAAGEPARVADADGRERRYPRDGERLVVSSLLVEVKRDRRLVQRPAQSSSHGGGVSRTVVRKTDRRQSQALALVYAPGDPTPTLLRERALKEVDGEAVPFVGRDRLRRLIDGLRGPRTESVALEDVRMPALLREAPNLRSASNQAAVELMGRLCYHAWMAGRAEKA